MSVQEKALEVLLFLYIKNAIKAAEDREPTEADIRFLAEDSKSDVDHVREAIRSLDH